MDEYYEIRASDVAPATLEGEMWTLTQLAEFLEDIGAVEDGLADAVRIPDLDPEDRSNDTKLHTEDAKALLEFYRNNEENYGTRAHAFLELAWFTGARQGGIRALDLRDVELGENPYVDFRHRPDTGTPLKNKLGGERPVALTQETAAVLREYLENHRYDVHDDTGDNPYSRAPRAARERTRSACGATSPRYPVATVSVPTGRSERPASSPNTHTPVSVPRAGHRTRFGPGRSPGC